MIKGLFRRIEKLEFTKRKIKIAKFFLDIFHVKSV